MDKRADAYTARERYGQSVVIGSVHHQIPEHARQYQRSLPLDCPASVFWSLE